MAAWLVERAFPTAIPLLLSAVVAVTPASQVVFKSEVEVVRLDVSVTRGGQPVAGLGPADFEVTDRGVSQRVDRASAGEMPLSVLLVLDNSRSVAGEPLRNLIEAAGRLLAALRPDDRAALITFSADAAVRVPLTGDKAAVISALGSVAVGANQTALRDAVFLALALVPRDETRPLILVFTDGCDNSSRHAEREVLDESRRTAVVIHAVQLGDCGRVSVPSIGQPDNSGRAEIERLAFLEAVTQATGGQLWLLASMSSRQLPGLFARVLEEMRARYVLSYYPEGMAREGWHDVKVRLKTVRAEIKARSGYLVPPL